MVYLTMNLTCIMLKFSYDFLNLFLAYLPKAMISDNPYPGPSTRDQGVDCKHNDFIRTHGPRWWLAHRYYRAFQLGFIWNFDMGPEKLKFEPTVLHTFF